VREKDIEKFYLHQIQGKIFVDISFIFHSITVNTVANLHIHTPGCITITPQADKKNAFSVIKNVNCTDISKIKARRINEISDC